MNKNVIRTRYLPFILLLFSVLAAACGGEPEVADELGASTDASDSETADSESESAEAPVETADADVESSVAEPDSADSSDEEVAPDLPIVDLTIDEVGPSDLPEMVEQSTYVIHAELVEVNGGLRYFGPDEEAPDATVFEEVELVFAPLEEFKGDIESETIAIPWTAHTTEDKSQGSKRLGRVRTNGLVVDELSIGEQYGLFITDVEGVNRVVSSEGLVPLGAEAEVVERELPSGGFLVREFVGSQFTSLALSE